jgi:hypothetical protein
MKPSAEDAETDTKFGAEGADAFKFTQKFAPKVPPTGEFTINSAPIDALK